MIEPAVNGCRSRVLTGFLGSGKTTLLNRLLQDPRLADSAVLVNEFGEVGLDHWLIERVDAETVLLPSGCVCCTIRAELRDALLELWTKRRQGCCRRSAAWSWRPRASPIPHRSPRRWPPTRACRHHSASGPSSPWSMR